MDLSTVNRRAYIADRTGSGTASDLRHLLSEQEKMGSFLEQPACVPLPGIAPGDGTTATLRNFSSGEVLAERFRIVRFIAHGGMGDVYEAEDLAQSRKPRVALKTIRPEVAANRHIARQFEREIELGKTVTHPNVCRIHDLGLHRDSKDSVAPPLVFLTMELLTGITLAEHLRHKKLIEPSDALTLIRQISAGLDAAHEAQVIHRDLKPGNIMLVSDRTEIGIRAVITDFGLAQELTDPNCPGSMTEAGVAGTPDYMSPEQVLGLPIGRASDIYSLGVIAYQMVTGKLPFEGEQGRIRMMKRLHESPVPPCAHVPSLPAWWQAGILRCLEREPADRFATAFDLTRALELPTGAARHPGGTSQAATRALAFVKRRKLLAASVALVLAASAAGWSTWSRSRGELRPEAARLYQQGLDDVHAGAYFAATKALEQAVQLAPEFSPARARLAESWYELDLPERAAREFLPIRRRDNSALPKLDQLQIEAVDLTITREFSAALIKYEAMLRETGQHSTDLNVDLGRAYEKAGKPDKSLEAYLRAAKGPQHSPAAWLRLAVLYGQRSQAAASEEAFQEADRRYRLTSNLEGLTEVALQNGVAANNRGQLDEAAGLLRKAMELAHEAGNLQQEISARLTLANNAYAAGNSALAEHLARESLATAQANQMEALTIRGLVNLGNAYVRKGDLPGAEKFLADALALARRTKSARLTALSLLTLASLYDRMNRSSDQIREATEALDYYQRNRWVQQSFQGLSLIGRGELDLGNYAGALESFQRLLAGAEKAQDTRQVIEARENLGNVLFAQEQFPQALEQYQAFLRLAISIEKTGYAELACGKTLWRLGRYAEADLNLNRAGEAAKNFPQFQLSVMRSRAEMLLSQKRWQEAAALARKALLTNTGKTQVGAANLTRIVGLAWLRSGKKDAGRKLCEEALLAAQGVRDPATLLDARLAALESRLAGRDFDGALRLFQDVEPSLQVHPESRWRSLAMMAKFDSKYLARARDAIHELQNQWGDIRFRQYITRQDVVKTSWPLLHSDSAKR